jgi:hypothetical protein
MVHSENAPEVLRAMADELEWLAEREQRVRQSAAIRQWRPWERSTGPRTAAGKARVVQNAYKGGARRLLRTLSRLLNNLDTSGIRDTALARLERALEFSRR